jgi:hypothetical protein
MPELIKEADLMEWCGIKRRTALMNWLQQKSIPYFLGQGGRICVTDAAINRSLLTESNLSDSEEIDFKA